jgi:putative ABC transport system permease protein
MVTALTVGIFGVGTMLGSFSILTREIERNYRSTAPASATLELASADDTLTAEVRKFPGIADAEARATILSRIRVGNDWARLLLFVINDFNDLRLNTFERESGAWPPPPGTMLVERSSVKVLKAGIGATPLIKTPHGIPREVPVSGLVHDTSLAPGVQEQTVYGYITRDTLGLLGEKPVLDELRIRVADHPFDRTLIETTARNLASRLQTMGRIVRQIQVPQPGRHPHQSQMEGVLFLFITFSVMALVLSALLVATLISAVLARQIREIGVMKAVGATTGQITAIYFAMVALLGAVATASAMPLALLAARMFSDAVANLLNFTIMSYHVPFWVLGVQIASGILVPLVMAAFPIMRGARVTVREAINDYGLKTDTFGQQRLDSVLARLQGISRAYLLALRNMFRRRGRLILSLGLLAAGGGMFMTALNVRDAWEVYVGRIYSDRHYDVQIKLNEPEREDALRSALQNVRGIAKVETWGYSETTPAQPGMVDIVRTYPDGGHGSFVMLGAPPETLMVTFRVLAGRWLRPIDSDAVVLNQMARSLIPDVKINDTILLSLNGRAAKWRVAGIVEEIGFPAAAYVSEKAYARAAGLAGRAQMIRITSSAADQTERVELIRSIEQALADAGVSVREGLPLGVLRTAMVEHVSVLVNTLIATAVLLGLIGVLGLASTMSMNVIERTRELGVLRAIGAAPGTIMRIIISEGVLIGGLSWVFAIMISVPLSLLVGRVVGMLSFKVPLALTISPHAMLVWLVVVLAISAAASAWPALQASRLTVREALAYG